MQQKNGQNTDSLAAIPAVDQVMKSLHQRAQSGCPIASEAGGFVNRLSFDLGSRYSPKRTRLDRFEVYHANQKAAMERIAVIANGVEALAKEGRGVLFYGAVGTGKDHLLAGLMYLACAQGIECKWVNGQDLYGTMRDRIDSGQRENEILQELTRPRILAISDPVPPVGDLSSWRLELLYRLVNRRYHQLNGTWMTLNATSPEEAEAKLSSLVWDRLQESAELIPCFWPSYRERRKAV